MHRTYRFILTTHRILSLAFSILFTMWFLSGLVMIYHTFPKVTMADRWSRMDHLNADSLPVWEEIRKRLPDDEQIRHVTLSQNLGQTVFYIQTDKAHYELPADGSERHTVSPNLLEQEVRKWNQSPTERIDTLYTLEQWIPFGAWKEHFPIYKYYFADSARHQLYISSKTAEVLQYTNRSERIWAWIGAIPHWVYFTSLRQDVDRWSAIVITLSGIGCIFCLTGLYLSIHDLRLARRRHRFSPYRKFWYKWHHILGTCFGLSVLAFCFSGMMSLADVKDLGIRPKLDFDPQKRLQAMRPEHYPLDYRKILQSHPGQIRQLSWNSFGTIPLYQAQTDYGSKIWDARHSGSLQTLNLTADDIRPILETVHGPNSIYDIQWMTRQDIYYISNKKTLTLPVWKVQIKNADASCYYIDPFSGSYRYVDRPARWQHWMYPALHSLQLPGLVNHPWLWHALMWFLMLGGTFVSVSGVWLTIKYLLRKIRN